MRNHAKNMNRLRAILFACAMPLMGLFFAATSASAQDAYSARLPLSLRPAQAMSSGDALPSQIASMPDVTAQMKVIQRRSQVVVAKSRIVRYSVADSSVADVAPLSPTEFSMLGLSLGSTTVALWFEDHPDPLIYLVEVVRDPSVEERQRFDYGKLEQKLALLFPNSKVYLIPLARKIIVKGEARDSQEAALILQIVRGEVINQVGSLSGPQGIQPAGLDPTVANALNPQDQAAGYIVNMLNVPGEFQVMLRVRIAELNRSMLRRMGVNFSALINDGQGFFSSALTGGATALAGGAIAAGGTGGVLQGIFSSGDVTLLVDALAANGTTRILAEPNVVVLSGHPASFISGGEFAVPTIVGIGGAQGQQTSFRGFGVSLNVTPTVLDKDFIRMTISPEFSQINRQNAVNGIFGTNTRRVQTTVQLREGQTIALAGLLSHQSEAEVDRIPFLGEIPLIGPLVFNSKRATQDEKELLILVSPEIVRPLEADEVPPVPGYEVTVPDDRQLFFNAQTEGAPDQRVNQLAPYGHGAGQGIEVGYSQYNPAPAAPGYGPVPTAPFGIGHSPAAAGPFGNGAPGTPMSRYPSPPAARRANSADISSPRSSTPVPQRNTTIPTAPQFGPSAGRYGGYSVTPAANDGYVPPGTVGAGGSVPASYVPPLTAPQSPGRSAGKFRTEETGRYR